MRNVLRKDAMSQVWNGTSKINENNNGGLGIWTTPPAFHNAYNPAIFTRIKFFHQVDTYIPQFSITPNYITIDNATVSLVFAKKTTTPIYIECLTDVGIIVMHVYSGVDKWQMSQHCSSILSISRLGFDKGEMSVTALKDNSSIYLRQGQSYEDDMYICKDENNIIYRNDEIDTCEFTVFLQGDKTVTLYAESFKGKVIFNASEVVKKVFNQELALFGNKRIIRDKALYATYSVKGIGGSGTTYKFMAINAVAQIGYSSDRTNDGGKVLTRMPAVKMYDGYPLDCSVLSTGTELNTANRTALSMSVFRILVNNDSEKILTNQEDVPVLNENESEIVLMGAMDIRVFRECIPMRPFYIRWLNDLGGVDYFMFSRQQKHQPQVKSVSTYSPYIESTASARTNLKAYAMSTDNTVTVGCSGLSRKEFDAISRMPFSSLIEWFNEDTGKWIRLAVSKYDGSYYSKPETKGVEVTFSLPQINTQF